MPEGSELHAVIQELLARKMRGEELDREPRIDVLNAYLDSRLIMLEEMTRAADSPADPIQMERLDEVFRDTLAEAWR
jgi:predicted nucleotidyltransferase